MCPACEFKRVHGPAEWLNHPYRTHGYNGSVWTHPDLAPQLDGVDHAGAANLVGNSGEDTAEAAAPAAEGEA